MPNMYTLGQTMKEKLALRPKLTDGQMEGRMEGTGFNVSVFLPLKVWILFKKVTVT